MYLALWQIDARAGGDGRVGFAGPHAALSTQDEEHFFVLMKMIRRAAGRDRAHKLSGVGTTDLIVDQHSIPAIGGWLSWTICKTHERRLRLRGNGRRDFGRDEFGFAIRIRALRADHEE